LGNQNSELENRLLEAKKESEAQQIAAQEELEKQQAEFEARQRESVHTLSEFRARSTEKVNELTGQFLTQQRKYKSKLRLERETRSELEQRCTELESELVTTRESSRDADELNRSLDAVQSDLKKVESENRVLKKRSKQTEKELSVAESQAKIRVAEVEATAESKLKAMSSEFTAQIQTFLREVCRQFPAYADLSSPISFNTVYALLAKVRSDVERFSGAQGTVDALLEERTKARQEIGELREKLEHLRTWMGKVYAICGGRFSGPTDPDEMEAVIERRVKQLEGRNSSLSSPSRGGLDPLPGSPTFNLGDSVFGTFLNG
jgi:DNA repair exonuclease SbcCD ATPase subunit